VEPSSSEAPTALVVFMPSGRRGRFPLGTPILEAARSLGVYIDSVCGGRAACGRCQVVPGEGQFPKLHLTSSVAHLSPAGEAERRIGVLRHIAADRRLSCQTLLLGDMVIDVPVESQTNRQVVRKRAENRAIPRDPAVRLYSVEVEPPDMARPGGDLERLLAALRAASGLPAVEADPSLLPGLQKVLRKADWSLTCAVHQDEGPARLIALWPGEHARALGLAVDIGSTTIAGHLMDFVSGRTIASAGTANPQVRFGEDLMSRVSYAMLNEGGQAQLTEAVRGAVRALIDRLTGQVGATRQDILDVVAVGNPIMHHLFLGIDPSELGQAPFALALSGAVAMRAAEVELDIHPGARLYMLPCIAGHVGADAAAAILAEGPQSSDETTLLVDIGTNAEIVLGNRHRVLAASSPTGPAFEGAEISSGQRAAPGAIERVRIDPVTLEPRIKVLGVDAWSDEPEFETEMGHIGVTGICGSGVIEAVAELFLAGIIARDGTLRPGATASDRVVANGRTHAYALWCGTPEIWITQTDVRAIQLAKAALYAGVRLLMDHLGVDTVERIRLAGAFGSYIDPKYAMILGLIPDCRLDKVSAVGNAAGTGARMALLNRGHRREIEELVERVEKIETAIEPRFQEHFVNAMALPNNVEAFPHLAAEVALPVAAGGEDAGPPRRRRGLGRHRTDPPIT